MTKIVNLCCWTFFLDEDKCARIEITIYNESRSWAPRKRNLPASMEKSENQNYGKSKTVSREIFALCEISGLQEICDWLLVGIFLYNISYDIEQKNTVGIFLYNILYIGAGDDQSLIIHRPNHPKYTMHHSFHQLSVGIHSHPHLHTKMANRERDFSVMRGAKKHKIKIAWEQMVEQIRARILLLLFWENK